ncbi:MAG TPA: DUF5050 domain-containing protein [Clostridiales bacterium]|nr:DUF5050 domain-containing protein [Clostridiales bacterium]
MAKLIIRIFIALTILTSVSVAGIYFYNRNRTYYNSEDEVGNTAGNIYNGGLFCEQGGNIYFCNNNADGSLFVANGTLTSFRQVSTDKAVYINADDDYLYYVRANDTRQGQTGGDGSLFYYNTGIYRIKHNGSDLTAFTSNPAAYLSLKGNYVYFQKYDVDNGLFLYRTKIDKTEEQLLVKDSVIPAEIEDDFLYYTRRSKNLNLCSLNLSSYTTRPVIKGSYLYPIYSGDYIYYMNTKDHRRIYRMNRDGSEPTKLVNQRCSTYNITNSGQYLYYQVDNNRANGVHRLNLDTMEDEIMLVGDYKQIHVTENYVFFLDYDGPNTYYAVADGEALVNIFKAPASAVPASPTPAGAAK